MRGLVHQVGLNTSDATATAGDLLSGETAYVNGDKITGSMPERAGTTLPTQSGGSIVSTVNDPDYSGVHALITTPLSTDGHMDTGTQVVQRVLNLQPGNIKTGVIVGGSGTAGMTGTFTADATATAAQMLSGATAYVNGAKVTGTIPSKAAATITPGTSNQTLAAGQYLSGAQTIAGDADLVSTNIKAGANIFGIAGNANVVDTSAGTAAAGHILSGYKAYVDGALLTGTIPSQGAQTITPGTVNKTIASGRYLSGTQTIAGDADLIAANIISGKNIFGVAGNAQKLNHVTAYKGSPVVGTLYWTVTLGFAPLFVLVYVKGTSGSSWSLAAWAYYNMSNVKAGSNPWGTITELGTSGFTYAIADVYDIWYRAIG